MNKNAIEKGKLIWPFQSFSKNWKSLNVWKVTTNEYDGSLTLKNYPANANCFIDVAASSTCESIEIHFKEIALEPDYYTDCLEDPQEFASSFKYYIAFDREFHPDPENFDLSDCPTIPSFFKCFDYLSVFQSDGEELHTVCGCNGNGCSQKLNDDWGESSHTTKHWAALSTLKDIECCLVYC